MSDVQPDLGSYIDDAPTTWNVDDAPRPLLTEDRGRAAGVAYAGYLPASSDRAWAVAFKMNVAITVVAAVYFHRTGLAAAGDLMWLVIGSGTMSHGEVGVLLLSRVLIISSAYAFSWALVRAIASFSKTLLKMVIVFFAMSFLGITMKFFYDGKWWNGTALAILSTVMAKVFRSRRRRIDFATANLKIAAIAVTSTPKMLGWALCLMVVRLMWFAVAGIALFGSILSSQTVTATDGVVYSAIDCNVVKSWLVVAPSCECSGTTIAKHSGCELSSPNVFLNFFWIASVMWSYVVPTNIIIATVSVSVASWWSSPHHVESAWVSSRRVICSSFGPMSKAAWIGGFVRSAFLAITHFTPSVWVIRFCLLYAMRVADCALDNTVYIISLHRLGFSKAARRSGELYRKYCLAILINQGLAAGAHFVGFNCVVAGVVLVFPGMFLPTSLSAFDLLAFTSLVIAATTFATSEVLLYACNAVSISFIQESKAFSASHDRRLYDELNEAWKDMGLSLPTVPDEQQ